MNNTGGTFAEYFLLLFSAGGYALDAHCLRYRLQCVTIIGIPVGIANFVLPRLRFWPVGRRVVSVEPLAPREKLTRAAVLNDRDK